MQNRDLMSKYKIIRQSFCICRKLLEKLFISHRHIIKMCHYDSERDQILIPPERRHGWNAEHDRANRHSAGN